MIRLYVNITNKCNANCEFCCMWSSTDKKRFMSFNEFKQIIDGYNDDFELQLEGGEPLLHENIYLFMEYSRSTNRCKKVIILTNGILLQGQLNRFVNFHKYYGIPILIKMSINYWLYNINQDILDNARDLHLATEFIDGLDIKFNVRLRKEDKWLEEKIIEYGLQSVSSILFLQRYGRYENEEGYELPVIVQNIDDWFLYSCDGQCFGKDLLKRSEHERELG